MLDPHQPPDSKFPLMEFWFPIPDSENSGHENKDQAGLRGFSVRLISDRIVVVHNNHHALPPSGDWDDLLGDYECDDPEGVATRMLDAGFTGMVRPKAAVEADIHRALVDWICEFRSVMADRGYAADG